MGRKGKRWKSVRTEGKIGRGKEKEVEGKMAENGKWEEGNWGRERGRASELEGRLPPGAEGR